MRESNGSWRPAIDHTYLSPSGRVSKRAREAANKRLADELFGPNSGFAGWGPPPPTEAEAKAAKRTSLLRHAALLRDFAARGYRVKYHTKHAEIAEAEAAKLIV
jgi:hypothetical protein